MISVAVSRFLKRALLVLPLSLLFSFSCKKEEPVAAQNPPANQLFGWYLSDTGQVTSYTTTKGEDSDFDFHAPSFQDNGDGTTTDNLTGLMWQKTDGGEISFDNAASYCKSLALGGHSDWRLPVSQELFDINNFDNVNPALNALFFTKTLAEYWWTSDLRGDEANYVWVVNAGGGIGAHPKSETISAGGTKKFHVRAVRTAVARTIPAIHFKDNGDGTITDNYTGLIWQKMQSSTLLSWEEALNYALGLSLTGMTDWRVPNIKELQSLNDEKLVKPSFNKIYFPNILSGNFWSSTSQVNATNRAWDLNVDYGIVSYSDKTIKANVICVRGGSK